MSLEHHQEQSEHRPSPDRQEDRPFYFPLLGAKPLQLDKLELTWKVAIDPPLPSMGGVSLPASSYLQTFFPKVKWLVSRGGSHIIFGRRFKESGRYVIGFNGIKRSRSTLDVALQRKPRPATMANQFDTIEWQKTEGEGLDLCGYQLNAAAAGLNHAEAELLEQCVRIETNAAVSIFGLKLIEFCREFGPGLPHEIAAAFEEVFQLLKNRYGAIYTKVEYVKNPCVTVQAGTLDRGEKHSSGSKVFFKLYPKGEFLRLEVVYRTPKSTITMSDAESVRGLLVSLKSDAEQRFEALLATVPTGSQSTISYYRWTSLLNKQYNLCRGGGNYKYDRFINEINGSQVYDPAALPKELLISRDALRKLSHPQKGILEKCARGRGMGANGRPFYVLRKKRFEELLTDIERLSE